MRTLTRVTRPLSHSGVCPGFFTIYLYTSNGDPQRVIVALSSALAVLIPIDILRLRYPSLEHAFEKCVGIFMRDSEKVCHAPISPSYTHHQWFSQKSSNGVIWYILGVNAVLVALPLDIAVVSVLMYVLLCFSPRPASSSPHSLSWADTAASTFGRLYGSRTPRLPKRLFGLLPLAPRKSLAGFIASTLTGTAISMAFWSLLAPARQHGLTWSWHDGVSQSFTSGAHGAGSPPTFAGWVGLLTIGVVAGLVTGIAEALGTC